MHDATPGWSNLIGPEVEWIDYGVGQAFHIENEVFWQTVEQIVLSFPGTYDEVPWQYTEEATRLLMQ